MNIDIILPIAAFILAGLPVIYMMTFLSKLPPMIPWFYSLPWGDERLIKKEWLLGFFGGLIILTGLNIMVAKLFESDTIAKRLVLTAGVVMNGLFMVTFIEIMKIVML